MLLYLPIVYMTLGKSCGTYISIAFLRLLFRWRYMIKFTLALARQLTV